MQDEIYTGTPRCCIPSSSFWMPFKKFRVLTIDIQIERQSKIYFHQGNARFLSQFSLKLIIFNTCPIIRNKL